MSKRGPIWRMIMWVERFLPTPLASMPEAKQSVVAWRRSALVPLIVFPIIALPMLLRERHQLGAIVRQNVTVFQQLALVVAMMCVVTAAIAGVVTWRREERRRSNGQ